GACPVASDAVVPPISSNPQAPTRPVTTAAFETVTLTAADVVGFPAKSRARAVMVWTPLATAAVFQGIVYGAAVPSAPKAIPSTKNCTPATATSSVASAP